MNEAQLLAFNGALSPYPTRTFDIQDIQEAFVTGGGSASVLALDSKSSQAQVPVSSQQLFLMGAKANTDKRSSN
jgi:hypothetical protein